MASGGHGISDAVRNSVAGWITERVLDLLWQELVNIKDTKNMTKSTLGAKLRNSSQWTRLNREKSDKAGIWSRKYYSKLLGKGFIEFTVLTNKEVKSKGVVTQNEDMHIESVKITLKGKFIGGGRVKIPSAKLSQKGKEASFELRTDHLFTEYTLTELNTLNAEMEHGGDAMFYLLEDDRPD
jgi:hypothetical protein